MPETLEEAERNPYECGYCHEAGPNSYWLIDHLEHCPVRWGHHHHERRHHHRHHRDTKSIIFSYAVSLPRHRKQVYLRMADLVLKDSDPPFSATVELVDAMGNPTVPDIPVGEPGGPLWAEDSNGTVIILETSADGMTVTGTPVAPGTANLTFSVTDSDGTSIVATGSVEVDPGEAVKATISFTPGVAPVNPQPTP